jgi:hypothetical protein
LYRGLRRRGKTLNRDQAPKRAIPTGVLGNSRQGCSKIAKAGKQSIRNAPTDAPLITSSARHRNGWSFLNSARNDPKLVLPLVEFAVVLIAKDAHFED